MREALVTIILVTSCVRPAAADPSRLDRVDLVEDTRELLRTVESVHPDPYLRAGGKIALNRLFQETLEAIPADGMSRSQYVQLIQPLLAAIGDGHTRVTTSPGADPYSPGGVPLYFEVAADAVYVLAVLEEAHRELLGARLLAVEGVPVDELCTRFGRLRAAENASHARRNLAGQGALWYGDRLRRILPEWTRADSVTVDLGLVDGSRRAVELGIPDTVDYRRLILPTSSDPGLVAELMAEMQRGDIFYRFLDPDRSTCLLVIRGLEGYREAFEVWDSYGITAREEQARALYQRTTGRTPPESYDDVLAGLPSATGIFTEMREEMRRAGTRNLLVELSQNDGGSSVLSSILVWSLYGRRVALDVRAGSTEIVKYSPEYFAVFPSPDLDEINSGRRVPLTENDYDLRRDRGRRGPEEVAAELDRLLRRMPTFAAAWNAEPAADPYAPPRVLVLCDAGTFSAAFTVMVHLRRAGAEVAGIPSSQSGNCFGDVLELELPRSGVRYQVSRKYFELFPGDPVAGRLLMPDHVATWGTLASYGFDPLALIRFAGDVLARNPAAEGESGPAP